MQKDYLKFADATALAQTDGNNLAVYAYVQAYKQYFPVQMLMTLECPNALYHDDIREKACTLSELVSEYKRNFFVVSQDAPLRIYGQMGYVTKIIAETITINDAPIRALVLY